MKSIYMDRSIHSVLNYNFASVKNSVVRFYILSILFCLMVVSKSSKAQDLGALFGNAQKHAFAGEYRQALDLCDSIIAIKSDHFDARILQARVYSWDKQFDQSIKKCKSLSEDFPDNKSVYLVWGTVERWNKEYSASLSVLSDGLEKHESDPELMLAYANTLKSMGKLVGALDFADSILNANQNALNANLFKIELLTSMDSTISSKKLADSLIKIFPENINLRVLRSKNWCAQNQFDTAYCDLDTGFQIDSASIALHHQNTNIPIWKGVNDTAIIHADKGLVFHPKDEILRTLMAKAYLRLDSLTPCDSICAVLLEEDSVNYDVWTLVLNSQLQQEKFDSVLTIVNALDTVFPADEELLRFRVLAYTGKKKYKKAIRAFEQGPRPIDSLDENSKILYTKLHFWDRQSSDALKLSNRFIDQHPKEPGFYAIKARIQKSRYEKNNALATIDSGLVADSANTELIELRKEVEAILLNQIGGFVTYDIWSNALDPTWNRTALTLEYQRRIKRHVLLGRVTLANRFDSTGVQFEIDAYPVFTDWMYAYVNVGVSNNFLFPQFRAGFEPFVSLPANFEASLGFRFLQYLTDDVTIFTGSIANYPGNFWISFRPYFIFKPNGLFQSYQLQARYFFKDPLTFLEAYAGTGSSPDNAYLDPVFTQTVESTSFNIGLGYQQKLTRSLHGKAWVIYDQYFPQQIADFNILSLNLGIWWRF